MQGALEDHEDGVESPGHTVHAQARTRQSVAGTGAGGVTVLLAGPLATSNT